MNLPQDFLERMEAMLGPEYPLFLKSFQEPRQFGLRVNTGKISTEEFVRLAPFHLTPIPWIPDGFYYEKEDGPARHPYYYAGLYYLQEPSAMTPASVLPVSPGQRVLDLCAAPGGKATALGAKLRGSGLLVANDISASRAKALLKNIEVFGIPNSFVTNAAPVRLAEQFPEYFDRILVDAPCSGEGMFRKDPASARVWSMKKVADCAKTQREIIRQATAMLKAGGLLLYSTCTFSPEENEQMIASLLSERPELELLPIPSYEGYAQGFPELADGNEELKKCVRIFPHRMGGEGHFLALLHKKEAALDTGRKREARPESAVPAALEKRRRGKGGAQTEKRGRRAERGYTGTEPPRGSLETLETFLAEVSRQYQISELEVRGDQVYSVQSHAAGSGTISFLRNGLYLGELKKGRFEPSQSFAMALRADEYASVLDFSPEDGRVRKYLCGETIEVEETGTGRESGWKLVCVSGYPLGWGRLVNGTLKNKYHPGWRMPV